MSVVYQTVNGTLCRLLQPPRKPAAMPLAGGGGKGEYLQNQFPELGIRNLELWAHRGCTQRGAFWLITINKEYTQVS